MSRYARTLGIPLFALVVAFTSCVRRENPEATPADLRSSSAERGYIDLQPGWKLQVIFPKLRSGGYVLPSMRPQSATAKTLEVQTNRDFLGYEKDFYKVLSRSDGGIEVRFSHAEFWENGKSHRKTQPGLLLFPREENGRYIRLVYLVRASAADHDMAIISAAAHDGLHALTEAVIVRAQCKSDESATCTWVPKGVAVDPER